MALARRAGTNPAHAAAAPDDPHPDIGHALASPQKSGLAALPRARRKTSPAAVTSCSGAFYQEAGLLISSCYRRFLSGGRLQWRPHRFDFADRSIYRARPCAAIVAILSAMSPREWWDLNLDFRFGFGERTASAAGAMTPPCRFRTFA